MTIWDELNIPADRIGLVKRNVELKRKLEQRGKAFYEIGEVIHASFHHSGSFDACEKDACRGVRAILKLTEG